MARFGLSDIKKQLDVWLGLPDVCGREGFVLAGKEKLSVAELMFLFFTEFGL